jgi:membrane-associated phospholipid phosphatase
MGMTGVSLLFANVYINIKIYPYGMDISTELFNNLGKFGPIILNITSIYFLQNKHTLLFYYIIGGFSDAILNLILKGLIQQPRPSENMEAFRLALTHGRRFLFKDGLPHDVFGMPSGHAESVFFSTAFIYCALKNKYIIYGYLALSLIVISQRVVMGHHTPLQVLVGAIVGAAFGLFVYYLATLNIKGHITEKLDDFGPI